MDTSEFDEVMIEFITESRENLDQLDQHLVALEQQPEPGAIAQIFRSIHTVKGTSGFLGLRTLDSVAHIGENLLSKVRDGELPVTQAMTNGLLAMVDAIRAILDNVETGGGEGTETYGPLIEELSRLNRGGPPRSRSSKHRRCTLWASPLKRQSGAARRRRPPSRPTPNTPTPPP